MHFEEDKIYHIFNRSNETVFYTRCNYLYFLKKAGRLIIPCADILAWCLMPNHFHFLVVARSGGCQDIQEKHRPNVQLLSKNLGTLLSSYTRAINAEKKRRGKLFAHNTQAKYLNNLIHGENSLLTWLHYIHENPAKSGLCESPDGWEFSSYKEYAGIGEMNLINRRLANDIFESEDAWRHA